MSFLSPECVQGFWDNLKLKPRHYLDLLTLFGTGRDTFIPFKVDKLSKNMLLKFNNGLTARIPNVSGSNPGILFFANNILFLKKEGFILLLIVLTVDINSRIKLSFFLQSVTFDILSLFIIGS